MLFKSQPSLHTISAKISGIPSEIALFRALSGRHLRLAAICGSIILANILAIFASSLFHDTYPLVQDVRQFAPLPSTFYPNKSTDGGFGPFYRVYDQVALNATSTEWSNEQYFFRPFQLGKAMRHINATDQYQASTLGIGAELRCEEIPVDGNHVNITTGMRSSAGLTYENGSISPSFTIVNTSNEAGVPDGGNSQLVDVCNSAFERIQSTNFANLTNPYGELNALYVWPDWTPMMDYNRFPDVDNTCADSFPFMGISASFSVSPENVTSSPSHKAFASLCKPVIKAAQFDVTVSPTGKVLSATQKAPLTPLPNNPETVKWRKKLNAAIQLGNSFNPQRYTNANRYLQRRRADTYAATNWALILGSLNSTSVLDARKWNSSALPDADSITAELTSLYSHLFTEYMALDPFSTIPIMDAVSKPSPSMAGTILTTQRRVLVSKSSFIVSEIILIIFLLTLVAVYVRPMDRGLPFVPTNLALTLALVHGSEASNDVKGTSGMSTRERERRLRELGGKYFVGWGDSVVEGVGKVRRYGLHREEWDYGDRVGGR